MNIIKRVIVLAFFNLIIVGASELTILFDQGQHNLTEDAVELLKDWSTSVSLQDNEKVQLTGYIDKTLWETSIDSLAYKRAISVQNWLLNNSHLEKSSFYYPPSEGGRYRILPITREGQRVNRNVTARVIKRERGAQFTEVKDTIKVLAVGTDRSIGGSDSVHINYSHGGSILIYGPAKFIVSDSGINLKSGTLFYSQEGVRPLSIKTSQADLSITGNIRLTDRNDTVQIWQFSGETSIGGREKLQSHHGAIISSDRIQKELLPETPLSFTDIKIRPIIGTKSGFELPKNNLYLTRVFIENSRGISIIDTTTNESFLELDLPSDIYSIQMQYINEIGFGSIWSNSSLLTIEADTGFTLKTPVIKNDTTLYSERYLYINGDIAPVVTILINGEEIEKNSNSISHSVKLEDELNRISLTLLYPDGTTIDKPLNIFYDGADEKITINDSILGRPAFTPTRKFIMEGNVKNGKTLTINSIDVPLDSAGNFTKPMRLNSYGKHNYTLQATYHHDSQRVLETTVERIKYSSFGEDSLFKLLALSLSTGLLLVIGYGF